MPRTHTSLFHDHLPKEWLLKINYPFFTFFTITLVRSVLPEFIWMTFQKSCEQAILVAFQTATSTVWFTWANPALLLLLLLLDVWYIHIGHVHACHGACVESEGNFSELYFCLWLLGIKFKSPDKTPLYSLDHRTGPGPSFVNPKRSSVQWGFLASYHESEHSQGNVKVSWYVLPSVYLMGMVSSFVVIEYYICPHIQKEKTVG